MPCRPVSGWGYLCRQGQLPDVKAGSTAYHFWGGSANDADFCSSSGTALTHDSSAGGSPSIPGSEFAGQVNHLKSATDQAPGDLLMPQECILLIMFVHVLLHWPLAPNPIQADLLHVEFIAGDSEDVVPADVGDLQ